MQRNSRLIKNRKESQDEVETRFMSEERMQVVGSNKQNSATNDDKSENKMSTTKYMDIINVLNNVVKDIDHVETDKRYLESNFVRSKQYQSYQKIQTNAQRQMNRLRIQKNLS